MPTLSQEAVSIIQKAVKERKVRELPHDTYTIASLYDTYPNIVKSCIYCPGFEMGTTTARKIIRAEIEHMKARKEGELLQKLDAQSTYKGTRKIDTPGKRNARKWGYYG